VTQLQPPTQQYAPAQPYAPQHPAPLNYVQPGFPAGPGFGYAPPPAPKKRTGLVVGSIIGALVVVAGLVVGALIVFGKTTINTAEAEKQIAQLTQDQAGIAATDVSCPTDVEAKAGDTFTCTASLDGQPVTFTITQKDDQGNVNIALDNNFVVISQLEDLLSQQVAADAGVEVTSSCDGQGHSVLVDGIGTQIACTVTNASDSSLSIDVLATVDADGNLSYEQA
jgi:hypothetical protein